MKSPMAVLLVMAVQFAILCGSAMAIICQGGKSQCPDGSTCCMRKSGEYGCCALPQAVCCADLVHCCPAGYTCDPSAGTCYRGDVAIDWLSKISASSVIRAASVICPDQKSECPDGFTCCIGTRGTYSCCPLPKAVCCSDYIHCCPNGYQCDVPHKTCTKGLLTTALLKKTQSTALVTTPNGECPDKKSRCTDGQTCCKQASGGYGCCPLPKAVCCSDYIHCCPNGYQCDVPHQRCIRGSQTTEWLEKTPATSLMTAPNDECPDHKTSCPSGQTCCIQASGGYGCCPLPQAVCCSDYIHCCPNGYQCDVPHQRCIKGSLTTEWLEKTPATSLMTAPNDECPDHKTSCPSGQTCCIQASGGYGCCPLPKAVCCSDYIHCCPNGYRCDVPHQRCIKGSLTTAWLQKTPATSLMTAPNDECPDHKTSCPSGQTCCIQASGGYGCCPLPQAVCCSDYIHCCPNGYQCDVPHQRCIKMDTGLRLLFTASIGMTEVQARGKPAEGDHVTIT